MRELYTPDEDAFIELNYKAMSYNELSQQIAEVSGNKRDRVSIKGRMYRLRLCKDVLGIAWSKKEENYLWEIQKKCNLNEMSTLVSAKFGNDRKYFAVWVFTNNYIGEIRNPLSNISRTSFEVVPFAKSVDWMRVSSQEYDLVKATSKSQLTLDFTTIDGFNGLISSVGEECDDLLKLYRDVFIPNLSR